MFVKKYKQKANFPCNHSVVKKKVSNDDHFIPDKTSFIKVTSIYFFKRVRRNIETLGRYELKQ